MPAGVPTPARLQSGTLAIARLFGRFGVTGRIGMQVAKTCPHCGDVLQAQEVPRSLIAGRVLAADLLLWFTAALFLAFLWSPRAEGEGYAILGSVALIAWALLRSRQRADSLEFAVSGKYRCEQCDLQFEGDDLRERPPS
ncbi:MAG: hypothetical protein HC807_01410 [Gammaproteobacteria bacterium]|nr:hypothetical protein [Gammaproteobacteria bacterium]